MKQRADSLLSRVSAAQLALMIESGMSLREIGRELNCAQSTVFEACRKAGIERRDRITQSNARTTYHLDNQVFVPPLNPPFSWLLGIIATDGSISDIGRLTISSMDKEIVDSAKTLLGFGHLRTQPPRLPKTRVTMWEYSFCSRELAKRLEYWGIIPRKTKVLSFPCAAELSLSDYIRGLWDGDGFWSIDHRDGSLRTGFVSASESFIKEVYRITSEIAGSRAYIHRNGQDSSCFTLRYQGKPAVRLAKWMYCPTPTYFLERKLKITAGYIL